MERKSKIFFNNRRHKDEQKKAIKEREKVNDLYFKYRISKRVIAKREGVSRRFVDNWTQSPNQDFTRDNRGWKKSKGRKWGESTEEKIKEIREYLEKDPDIFYTGATAIETEWRRKYPDIDPPPLRTIGRIMSNLGLVKENKRGRNNKGAAKYLCYPEHTIYELFGGRVLEVDFLGDRHLRGKTDPLNFIGFSFKKEPKLRYFKRVESQRADDFIDTTAHFFNCFEKPDFVKVDNCGATIGSGSGKRGISRVIKFLLEKEVIPIFAVPRKPFTQASIEGNNSVFSKKFWNRIEFNSIEEVDKKLDLFNKASQEYTGYEFPIRKEENKEFVPKVYFIRQVREDKENSKEGFIDVVNERVFLPESFINYFILAEWNLKQELLYIRFEKEKKSEIIKKISFRIHERSKKKCQEILKI